MHSKHHLFLTTLLALSWSATSTGQEPHLSRFGAGGGPTRDGDVIRLLGVERVPGQNNAVAFDREHEGAFERVTLQGRLRVLEGGDGGSFALLHTGEYGARGPAPFLPNVVEPNLRGTFAVGLDVHNPPDEEMFSEWGNYMGLPQREVSLHFDGRELVKRTAAAEFRGDWTAFEVRVEHVCGGAEVTVQLGEELVFDRFFVAGFHPYESRLSVAAATRADATTEFDVAALGMNVAVPAAPRRPPVHVEVFNHVLTDNSKTEFEAEVELPPTEFAFGRIVLTLEIHDAGLDWDEWDRQGRLSVVGPTGEKWDIVPFITSYRTECRWRVDVTQFRPWLAGKTTWEIHAGTKHYKNRGFMMSVSVDYFHGIPEPEPFRVVPLWHGTARYQSEANHFRDFFTPQRVEFPEETVAARVFTTTTGHSQIGEFTPSRRALVLAPDAGAAEEVRFADTLWKTDCYLNPNRPQFGTWKFARAGWAPGDVVHPWMVDLTPHLIAGGSGELRIEPQPYAFGAEGAPKPGAINNAKHVVRSYLVLYRAPHGLVAAPTLRVIHVEKQSGAARAGLRVGDSLASYDDVVVDDTEQLGAAKQRALDAGKERVPLVAYRGAERLELEIETGQLGVQLRGG